MAQRPDVYVLGGYQTDFARNWSKEKKALRRHDARGGARRHRGRGGRAQGHRGRARRQLRGRALQQAGPPGRLLPRGDPAFSGLPTARHEAACASGSIALLAATAEIEAGWYDCAAVVGIEQMKTVNAAVGGDYLGTAAWYELEAKGIEFPFPKLFGKLGDEYDKRYGLKDEHLAGISAVNYANAKLNPNAQTRTWYMNKDHAMCRTDDNAAVGGRIRISDCSQVTDGAVVFVASAEFAKKWAARRGMLARPGAAHQGLGPQHGAAALRGQDRESAGAEYVLPHVRSTITDALKRAAIADVRHRRHRDARLLHHQRVHGHRPLRHHQARRELEGHRRGRHRPRGQAPHQPERRPHRRRPPGRRHRGAPGARRLQAGDRQRRRLPGRRRPQRPTLNIGGSGTTSVTFVVGT
jgi:acetyl-CoA C-acetyltransferase